MVGGIHVGEDDGSLLMQKHHMTPQIPCISKIMAIDNFERLISWSC
jgi:hypothetical protein